MYKPAESDTLVQGPRSVTFLGRSSTPGRLHLAERSRHLSHAIYVSLFIIESR